MKLRQGQGGFTLVEIAIVLIIIGLLLGAVLKGQELIDQTKIKRVVNDFNAITAAIYSYKDRYGFYPGDDPNAGTRWQAATGRAAAGAPTPPNGGNGVIDGLNIAGGANESGYAWQHLRLAGFVGGDVSDATRAQQPEKTPFDSNYVLGSGAVLGFAAGTNLFCARLPAKAAEMLDKQLDDGDPRTGNIRAGAPAAAMNANIQGAATTNPVYVDNPATPWHPVCRRL